MGGDRTNHPPGCAPGLGRVKALLMLKVKKTLAWY